MGTFPREESFFVQENLHRSQGQNDSRPEKQGGGQLSFNHTLNVKKGEGGITPSILQGGGDMFHN